MNQETVNTLGKIGLAGLGILLAWKGLGPERQQQLIDSWSIALNPPPQVPQLFPQPDWQAALARQIQEQFARSLPPMPPPMEAPQRWLSLVAGLSTVEPSPALPVPVPQEEPDTRWREVLVPPAVVLILGKRGSGKSALAYRLLELFRHRLIPLVVGPPQRAQNLLPDWIGIAPTLGDLPQNCIALIDEAYLAYHARQSHSQASQAMAQLLNLSRQRNQTLLFVTQEARQVDRNIASAASVVVFKELGLLQLEFDRPEFRRLVEPAQMELEQLQARVRKQWAYACSSEADFQGLLPCRLPTFWKPSLSKLFADGPGMAALGRPGAALNPQEKAAKARELREKGCSYSQIGLQLGVARSTVLNYLKGYPYRPQG